MNEEKLADLTALNRSTDALDARKIQSMQVPVLPFQSRTHRPNHRMPNPGFNPGVNTPFYTVS
jgi:hypothetical protein